jgi:hypothetical protein
MVAQRNSTGRAAAQAWARAFGSLFGLCIVVATVAQAADPPVYKEMPVDPPSTRGWNKARTCPQSADPKAMLRGDAPMDPVVFDPFFNSILFPQFTLYREEDEAGKPIGSNVLPMVEDPKDKTVTWRASVLPTCREEFLKQFVKQAEVNANPEPFNHLNALTVQAMRTIALGNYHPLSRYTAALVLSSLHDYQSEKPLKATLPILLTCLDSIDVVRIAALDGLLKHAKAGTDGAMRPQLVAAMLKIVAQKTPPAGRTAEGHDWIRRRAIDVLAAMGDAGPNLAVIAALDAILKDNQSSPELSCAAAKALGSISFRAPDGMNASATVFSIGQVAVDAYKSELARGEERKEAAAEPVNNRDTGPMARPRAIAPPVGGLAGGLGGIQPAGAGAAGAADVVNQELFISIPLLKSQLFALDHGLKGLVTAVAGTKDQQFAESVEKNMALLMAACDPNAADYDTLKTQIAKAGTGLEAALAAGSAVQGRAPALNKGTGASKEDSFDTEPLKPAATTAPRAVAPAAKAAPGS